MTPFDFVRGNEGIIIALYLCFYVPLTEKGGVGEAICIGVYLVN